LTARLPKTPLPARCEYCVAPGVFREDVDAFVSRALVEKSCHSGRKELSPAHSESHYAAFADVSGGRVTTPVAIAHREGPMIVLDCLERYKAPHNPNVVVAAMAAPCAAMPLDRATGDAYAAEWCKTAFESNGLHYARASTSLWKEGAQRQDQSRQAEVDLVCGVAPRLNSGEIELLDNSLLVQQLCCLERRTRSGAHDVIDHPPNGARRPANALAGVVDAVSQRRIVAAYRPRAIRPKAKSGAEHAVRNGRCRRQRDDARLAASLCRNMRKGLAARWCKDLGATI